MLDILESIDFPDEMYRLNMENQYKAIVEEWNKLEEKI
jgi:hypothetical protein